MAKRKRIFNREKYEKFIKEGRGQGIGSQYKPWLTIQDVPSKGIVSRVKGINTGRIHHFLSNWEKYYFYIISFYNYVVDIREQYPLLPIESTLEIAEKLGIEHPKDPKSQEYQVMTTDFLITVKEHGNERVVARTVKTMGDLHNKRQIEKFHVERQFWISKGVDWGIVTDKEIDTAMASNIEFIYRSYFINELDSFINLDEKSINKLIGIFRREIIGNEVCVRNIASDFESRMALNAGAGIDIFKHLVITKQIKVDLKQPLDIDKPQKIELPYAVEENIV